MRSVESVLATTVSRAPGRRVSIRLASRLLAALTLVASVGAQPYGTDIIVGALGQAIPGPSLLYRIDASGQSSIISRFSSLSPNSVAIDNDNHGLIVGFQSQGRIVSIDPNLGTVLRTLADGLPLDSIDGLTPLHTGDFVALNNSIGGARGVYFVSRNGGAVQTMHTFTGPTTWLQAVIQDLATGYILVFEVEPRKMHVIAVTGGRLTTAQLPLQGFLFSAAQDHADGALYLGVNPFPQAVMRFDPRSNTVTTLVTLSAAPNALAFDRAPGAGQIVTAAGPTLRVTPSGAVVATVAAPSAAGGPWISSGFAFEQSRNVVSHRTSANRWTFDVSFPRQSNRPYVVAFSTSSFTPGALVRGRRVPLNIDDVTRHTLSGGLSHVLRDNVGVLDPFGRARCTFNLSGFGNALKGMRLWAVAMTLDLASPSGLGTISKPIIVVLD